MFERERSPVKVKVKVRKTPIPGLSKLSEGGGSYRQRVGPLGIVQIRSGLRTRMGTGRGEERDLWTLIIPIER